MSKKRLQLILSEEAWKAVETLIEEATAGFEVGSISYSDAINEMILSAKVDIKALQLKHTDLRRSLRVMAAKDSVDIDSVIRSLTELKSKMGRKKLQPTAEESV